MLCKKHPLKVTRNPTVLQKVQSTSSKGMSDRSSWRCGVEVPAVHDLLTWPVSHATSMHRRFSVGGDGKTAYERSVERRAVPPFGTVRLASVVDAFAAIQPSFWPFGFTI